MKYSSLINQALTAVADGCDQNECDREQLAYLAATSKPEMPFRDRLAYELYRLLKDDHFVAREWYWQGNGQRADIAILHKSTQSPNAIIELKAWSLFAIEKHRKDMESQLKAAIKSWADGKGKHPELYWLLVSTRLESSPGDHLAGILKYNDGWRAAFSRYKDSQTMLSAAADTLGLQEESWTIKGKKIPGANVLGLDVSLQIWLLEYGY